jgi:branched-chain amino acid transport system permease protein
VQLTVYSLILMAVILWQPNGLMGIVTGIYDRFVRAGRGKEVVLDA